MKRTLFSIAALCLLCAGCARESGALKKEYRMQVTVGPTTHWGRGAARFAELVAEKTSGRVNVKPYYGSQLLRGAQLNSSQMVSLGSIDLAFESTINTAPAIPGMNVFSLPFFVGTYANVDALEAGQTGAALSAAMQAKGLTLLGWGENGFRQLTNVTRPVRGPEDLKGLRVRVVGSPIFIDIFRELGADPVNMNWGDAVTAFQQGVVDGQENPAGILLAVKIDQYHKYITRWNYVIDPLVLYWNTKQFDAFPPDIQSAIRDAAQEACRYQKALARVGLDGPVSVDALRDEFGETPEIADPMAHFREQGVEVIELTETEREAFVEVTSAVSEKWEKQLPEEVMTAARRDLGRE
jgi:tripartite ATP-independent transporter DctP family solute receptor